MECINWNEGYEDATHFLPEQPAYGWNACWYKQVDGIWYARNKTDCQWYPDNDYVDEFIPLLIERNPRWNGSGLPPIGTECEAFNDHLEEWILVRVIDHQGSTQSAVCREIGTDKLWWSDSFRPVKTAEEIAAEARKDCIDEMTKVIRRMPYVRDHYLAERLYENGFRIELKDEQL